MSRKLLQSLQSASELCSSALAVVDETKLEQCLNGDDMAKIAQSLNGVCAVYVSVVQLREKTECSKHNA